MINSSADATYVPAEFLGPLTVQYSAEATLHDMVKPTGSFTWNSDGTLALSKQGSSATVAPLGGTVDVQIAKQSRFRYVSSVAGITSSTGKYGAWSVIETTVKRVVSGNVYEITMDFADYAGVKEKKCNNGACGWKDFQYRYLITLINFVADAPGGGGGGDGGNGYNPGGGGYTPPTTKTCPDGSEVEADAKCPETSTFPWVPVVLGSGGVVAAVVVVALLLRKKAPSPVAPPA